VNPRLPSLRPAQVVRALERAGWTIDRQRGSHVSLNKPGVDHIITVPLGRRDMARGTLSDIIKDSGLTQDEFLKLT
jgi:predicted RNA binding protein YcfA (HicA-like mRNA interferase family)